MINYRQLMDWHFSPIEQTYTADDCMRYALALGLGNDPMDTGQLQFVNDTMAGTPLAMPTMAVVLGFPGSWMQDPATGIDFSQIVHGEERTVLHRALPVAATVIAQHRVTAIVDKGPGRGATVTYNKDLFDKASGDKLATVTHTTFARGDGGFSVKDGLSDASPPAPPKPPSGVPDRVQEIRTLPQQALLYRLCADRNPLHSQPEVAQAAGFTRPILHMACVPTASLPVPCWRAGVTTGPRDCAACLHGSRHPCYRARRFAWRCTVACRARPRQPPSQSSFAPSRLSVGLWCWTLVTPRSPFNFCFPCFPSFRAPSRQCLNLRNP